MDFDNNAHSNFNIDSQDILYQLLKDQIINQQMLSAIMARLIALEHQIDGKALHNEALSDKHDKIMRRVVEFAEVEYQDILVLLAKSNGRG